MAVPVEDDRPLRLEVQACLPCRTPPQRQETERIIAERWFKKYREPELQRRAAELRQRDGALEWIEAFLVPQVGVDGAAQVREDLVTAFRSLYGLIPAVERPPWTAALDLVLWQLDALGVPRGKLTAAIVANRYFVGLRITSARVRALRVEKFCAKALVRRGLAHDGDPMLVPRPWWRKRRRPPAVQAT